MKRCWLWFFALNLFSMALLAQLPANDSMTPSSGAGSAQTFAFKGSSPSGYSNIAWIQVWFNSGSSGCYAYLSAPSGQVSLLNDAGNSWLGPATLGSGNTIENSQCRVNLSGSSMSGSGDNLTW